MREGVGARDLAEVRVAERAPDADPIKMIGGVVELGAELHTGALRETEILLEWGVKILGAGVRAGKPS